MTRCPFCGECLSWTESDGLLCSNRSCGWSATKLNGQPSRSSYGGGR